MITRDGARSSLWQTTTEQYRVDEKNLADREYDVIIVGGGITGVTTADLLLREGYRCLLLEARNLCFGTTGGTTAHINTLLDTPYTQLIKNFGIENARKVYDACRHGIDRIRSNIRELERDCGWQECNAFLFSETEEQQKELQEIADACNRVGLDPHTTQGLPVPIPFLSAMSVAEQAKFHPTRYVHALARRFEEMGGTIVENCRVTALIEKDERVDVECTSGTFGAKWIILATHIPPTRNIIHVRCVPNRSYAMAFRISEDQHFTDLVYDLRDPYHYFRMQEIDGEKYLIAGGKDHKTGHEENTAAHMRQLESHVRKYFNVEEVTHSWSSQYYESADGLPYIGQLPGHSSQVLTATGFGGNGMIYGTIASEVLRNIITDHADDLVKLFSPSRIKPIAGFKNVASQGIEMTRKLIEKVFTSEEIEGYAELAPGESKVVSSESGKLAIHKDEHGVLHPVKSACTHMGCDVAWNNAESSWDCPCHGARYDVDGKMLNGPAVEDLEFCNIGVLNAESR
jgi:glycine/D-amino acid oxidase-like deaminating enzyme/nitrite reductase/ring-hydroxylating ferredoxin subunit